ncbi:MAG: V-type ATP synthase subunit I [Christensenellaceae bacterium]|jgi:V/A-type H+-transporting ATPase subunit I|nr:V-type ATP synthase subunit I [Christensenellaceae bacterium]
MRKLSVIGHKNDRRSILRTIASLGSVEIAQTGDMSNTYINKHLGEQEEISQKLARLNFAISFLQESSKELKKSEFSSDVKENQAFRISKFGKENVVMSYEELSNISSDEYEILAVIDKLSNINDELTDIKSKKSRITNTITQMRPYESLDIKFCDIKDTKNCSFFVGVLEKEDLTALSTLQSYCVVKTEIVESGFLVCIISHKDDSSTVLHLLQSNGFKRCPFTDATLAKVKVASLSDELSALEKRRHELYLNVSELFPRLKDFKLLYDYYKIEHEKISIMGDGRETKRAFILDAWIPSHSEDLVFSAIMNVAPSTNCFFRDPLNDERVPSLVMNSKLVRAFGDNITATFGTAEYGHIDPNPFVMFFYCLFFGFMFSDAGYGLIMTLACSLFLLIKKPVKNSGGFFVMFGLCGVSTVVWGTLFGGWFGLTTEQLEAFGLGRALLTLKILDPMDGTDILIMFGLALGLGIVQLATGFTLNGINSIRQKKITSGILDNFSWVAIFLGGGFFALSILLNSSAIKTTGIVIILIGVAMLLAGGAIGKKNPFAMLGGMFKNLYGAINVFADILSYSRIFSLCLTAGIIGMVINIIAGMMPTLLGFAGYIAAFVIYAVGHLFNFGINALGVYVHNSRLQYVEFFGKFFSGEGHAFSPLGRKTKYIYLSDSLTQPKTK